MNNCRIRAALMTAAALAISSVLHAQTPQPAQLPAVLDSMCTQFGVKGASAAVLFPGGSWSGACGEAWDGERATASHAYEIGSITKTYTAAPVLKLVDAGRLSLDDAVAPLLPGIPDLEGVTVRHLLHHTSGIYDFTSHEGYLPAMQQNFGRVWQPRELLTTFTGERQFAPGERWSYANAGYHLLGLIVEKITGRAFHEELRDRVLAPHNLAKTWLAVAESDRVEVAHAFLDINGDGKAEDLSALVPATSFRSAAWAAGGIIATAPDVARWFALLAANDSVVSSELHKQMLTGVDRGNGQQHGLGLILRQKDGKLLIGHNGNTAGFSAAAWAVPEKGFAVAVLTNLHATDVTPMAMALLDQLSP